MSSSTISPRQKNYSRLRYRRHNRLTFLCHAKTVRSFFLGFLWFAVTSWGRCLMNLSIPKLCSKLSHPISRFRSIEDRSGSDNCESIELVGDVAIPTDLVLTGHRNHEKAIKGHLGVNDLSPKLDSSIFTVKSVGRKIPTPWPISLINDRWDNRRKSSSETATNGEDNEEFKNRRKSRKSSYPSMGALFLDYAKYQARIGIRQVSEISAQIWYHLPPSAPPFILLASIPRNVKLVEKKNTISMTSASSFRRIVPMFSDPFARSVVLAGLGLAVVSWSNQELQRKKKLTPLALSAMSNDQGVKGGGRVSRVFLPPFLPEEVPEPEIDALLGATLHKPALDSTNSDELVVHNLEESILPHASPKIRRHLSGIYTTTTTTSRRIFRNYYNDWLQGRSVRKREVAKIRRNHIFDELVALQALKKRQKTSNNSSETKKRGYDDNGAPGVGYALVTGASRGIGRAIAVELARWEIPLVLVARDVTKLEQLASDIEACYGVRCCVLEADLSKATAAKNIHKATTQAGISIDILINNAGVASEGLAIDTDTSFVENMIMLNSLTFAKLSLLYGRDMKERRRGRILMMSSMAGLCNASPNTAVYGACKAFCKSLALSMAKEMESYGVGVTCLIPGAVSGTDFRIRSGTHKALCWYLPFYSRSPENVAHQGVISLLDGDTQSIPGWQNRAFANIVRPIIPQRLEMMLVQLAFSPLRIPSLKDFLRRTTNTYIDRVEGEIIDDSTSESLSSKVGSSLESIKTRHNIQPPPRLLKLPDDDSKEDEHKSKELYNDNLVNEDFVNEDFSSSSSTSDPKSSSKSENYGELIGIDKNTLHRSDTTSNIQDGNKGTKTPEIANRTESKTMEQESAAADMERGQEYFSNKKPPNVYGSDHSKVRVTAALDAAKSTSDLNKTQNKPLKNSSDEHGIVKLVPKNHENTERDVTKGMRRSKWFNNDNKEEDDDDTFSTKLGPVTITEQRERFFSEPN